MKKILALVLCFVLAFSLCACTGATPKDNATKTDGKEISVICTTFPSYDWTRNILGDNPANIKLRLLLDNGVDLHNYQPSADDIIAIGSSDLFVCVGGESDKWVKDVLEQKINPSLIEIDMLKTVGELAKEEEVVEGMEAEEGDEEEPELDEHIWLSLKVAQAVVKEIADKLSAVDSENAELYKKNAEDYNAKLAELDGKFENAIKDAKYHSIVVGDRFPFRYLADDYGLEYFAAFVGCSAETEASFETIAFLSKKTDELGVPAVLKIDGSDGKIAQTVVDNCTSGNNLQILTLNSMQSITAKDVEDGVNYISIMQTNLDTLLGALN